MSSSQSLVFAINGERFELSSVDPSTTLLEFLRTRTTFKGAKLGCGEGGCGACVVLLSKYDPVSGEVEDKSVSSCLTLLCAIHLCSITTSEGLAITTGDRFHAVHRRLAGFHASQCGFCSPGVCVSIFAALAAADRSSPPPPEGHSNLPAAAAAEAISGNLCRCTGYRPIVDACRSFAVDFDLEDLGVNAFWRRGAAAADLLPRYAAAAVCTFPDFLKTEAAASASVAASLQIQQSWYAPRSLKELRRILLAASSEARIKLVSGNTSAGVHRDLNRYDSYVDLGGISELTGIKHGDGNEFLEIGGAVSISSAIEALEEDGDAVFGKLAAHMKKVASPFVRNTASIGGNLVLAQRGNFPSDMATILLAAGASIALAVDAGTIDLSLENFFKLPPVDRREILVNVRIPRGVNNGGAVSFFETFRAAPRPLGNAIAYVNAAFSVLVNNGHVESSRLVFGAYGTRHATRAKNVEEFIAGKKINARVILEAIQILRQEIIPDQGTKHADYRVSAAVGFLFKFLSHLEEEHVKNQWDIIPSQISSTKFHNNQDLIQDRSLTSRQDIEEGVDFQPVGQALKKVGAELQASGEAVYVDDIPSPPGCLYSAFVYGDRPSAINEVKLGEMDKVVAYITAADIPAGGKNVGAAGFTGDSPLFGVGAADCAGQPLGIVVAETQKVANFCAQKAEIVYGGALVPPPIMSVEEAEERSSFFELPPFMKPPTEIGDFKEGVNAAEEKILSAEVVLGSQYYFYMETQTALAVPDEDGCIVVYGSLQVPEDTQHIIAKCLGVPSHNVRVITRRVGGGFGGKAFRGMPVAVACALAAHKLRRPVRMYLDRKTDMVMAGGRHPMKVTYSVWFKHTGKITALETKILIDAGSTRDISPALPINIAGTLKKYDWGATWMEFKVCRTNLPSRSAMRAPGEVQGSFIAEAIVEHVAVVLKVDPEAVRAINMHTYNSFQQFYTAAAGTPLGFTLPMVVDRVAEVAEWQRRREEVNVFNQSSRWVKRGISHIPVVMPVTVRSTPARVAILGDGSIVVEVGGVELGQGLWTKAAQMTAFSLGQLFDGRIDLLERVRVMQADTLSLVQGGYTAGSTTSESSCAAVQLACAELVSRLLPLKNSLLQLSDSLSWESLIQQAKFKSVNLSSGMLFKPEPDAVMYVNYGAAISEVEVDLLTGMTTILRSDLVYDGGKSLNPAVDLGQIEGAFVQGIGFFMCEEYLTNKDGLVTSDGTWTYKIPTVDNIPREFNVELLSSGPHQQRVLSSKASGEPPLLLSLSVHCATRAAIRAAREDLSLSPVFQLDVPATMPVVKKLCGFDNIETHLRAAISQSP
ncbi:aldehyde oxidase 1 [Wolffia australiana]